jgi:hypothetical protein
MGVYDGRGTPRVTASRHRAADAGYAGVGSLTQSFSGDPIEVVRVTAEPEPDFDREWAESNVAQTDTPVMDRTLPVWRFEEER